jgi:hypothetical protein
LNTAPKNKIHFASQKKNKVITNIQKPCVLETN